MSDITVKLPVPNSCQDTCEVLDLTDGDVFEDESGNLCLRVDDGWITLDPDGCVTAFVEAELPVDGYSKVTPRPDLRAEIHVVPA